MEMPCWGNLGVGWYCQHCAAGGSTGVPQCKIGVRDGGAAFSGKDTAAHGLPMGSSAVMGSTTK